METSFPSKLPEYAQFGKPIVIWGPEYCSAIHWGRKGDQALCITSASPQTLITALTNLRQDLSQREYYASQARIAARQDFHPVNLQQQFEHLLKVSTHMNNSRILINLIHLIKLLKRKIDKEIVYLYLFLDKSVFIGKIFQENKIKQISYVTDKQVMLNLNEDYNKYYEFYPKTNKTAEKFNFTISYDIPGYTRLTNVFYIPSTQCLYSGDGDLINISFHNSDRHTTPKNIDIPKKIKDINTEFLYIGKIEHLHYGHFLIEGISHLWGIKDYADFPLLYSGYIWTPKNLLHSRKRHIYIDTFIKSVGIKRENLFYFDQPVRLRSVIIPNPSLVFGKSVNIIHRLVPEFASKQILRQLNQKIQVSSQPVYFSRTKLKNNQRYRWKNIY